MMLLLRIASRRTSCCNCQARHSRKPSQFASFKCNCTARCRAPLRSRLQVNAAFCGRQALDAAAGRIVVEFASIVVAGSSGRDSAMTRHRLTPDTLRPTDLERTAVWEFTNEEVSHPDELSLRPIDVLPVSDLNHRLVGARVRLADGSLTWALLGNVSLTDLRATRHFLTASVWCGDRWFPLARYHDVARDKFGPVQLARALRKEISEIFPITYDIGSVAK